MSQPAASDDAETRSELWPASSYVLHLQRKTLTCESGQSLKSWRTLISSAEANNDLK
jgi:hypothetical protein